MQPTGAKYLGQRIKKLFSVTFNKIATFRLKLANTYE